MLKLSDAEIWEDQLTEIEFNCCMYAITILRFISDNVKDLSPSIIQRILEKHDMPLALVYVMENSPFKKKDKTGYKKYTGNKWESVSFEDYMKLTQYEAQVWLTLNNLLVDPETRNKYEYTCHRKETILKVRSGKFVLF